MRKSTFRFIVAGLLVLALAWVGIAINTGPA
jgi:hypothetical protein